MYKLPPIITGEDNSVSFSTTAASARSNLSYRNSDDTSLSDNEHYVENRVYISNIPFSYTEKDLHRIFSRYGTVANAQIVYNERGSKGFGFATLDSREAADRARIALDGSIMGGRRVEVKRARQMTRAAARVRFPSGQSSDAQPTLPQLAAAWQIVYGNPYTRQSLMNSLGFLAPGTNLLFPGCVNACNNSLCPTFEPYMPWNPARDFDPSLDLDFNRLTLNG